MSLIDIVRGIEGQTGHHISFYDEGGAIVTRTFAEIYEDARETARRLESWGVREGMRVGILGPNSYTWVLYDLASILLRATTVAFPEGVYLGEPQEIFDHYRLALLATTRETFPAQTLGSLPVVFFDEKHAPRLSLQRHRPEDNGAEYIPSLIFSSGSSGRPKALKTTEPGVLQVIDSFQEKFSLRSDDLFLIFLPFHSYQQRLMVYGSFKFGFDAAVIRPTDLFKGLKDFKPTLCLAPPILYETVQKKFEEGLRSQSAPVRAVFHLCRGLSRLPLPGAARRQLAGICYGKLQETFGGRIRILWTGMAPIRREALLLFHEARMPLFEAFGITECGVLTANTPESSRIGSVGRPVVDGSIHIMEDGEIHFELDHPLTTEYYAAEPGENERTFLSPTRIATNDIGYFDEDGFLYLKGRKNEIIVTREGHKIHPEVIEKQLSSVAGVLQSVVFGNQLPGLVAVVVVSGDPAQERPRVAAAIAQVNRTLPVPLTKLHLTNEEFSLDNGLLTRNLKIDRKAIFARYQGELTAA
jgi:long-subunit acyl-CoA synthetase (AMP-forming)